MLALHGSARLPLSGTMLTWSELTGAEQLLLLETSPSPLEVIVAISTTLLSDGTGEVLDWSTLPAVEVDAIAAILRRAWVGDVIRTDALCGTLGCAQRIEIAFSITEYLQSHRPSRPRSIVQLEDSWWQLGDLDVRFRVPTVADVVAWSRSDDPHREWRERCVRADALNAVAIRRLGRVLESLAPTLVGELNARCPECGDVTTLEFAPAAFVVTELADHARDLYHDVEIIASAFGWSEQEILGLPQQRRAAYATAVLDRRVAAS